MTQQCGVHNFVVFFKIENTSDAAIGFNTTPGGWGANGTSFLYVYNPTDVGASNIAKQIQAILIEVKVNNGLLHVWYENKTINGVHYQIINRISRCE